MFSILRGVARAFWSAFASRCGLAARNIALEHQFDTITHPARSRPRLRFKLCDRILLVWLSRTRSRSLRVPGASPK
jgi:hypothetical protein